MTILMTELQPAYLQLAEGAGPAPIPPVVDRSRAPAVAAKKRRHPEEDLQRQVVRFLRVALVGNSVFFHIPNGGKRGFLEAQRFKAMGVLPGVVDLALINDGRFIGFELKAGKGTISDAQAACHRQLRLAGALVYIVRSLDEVIVALQSAGVPLRVAGKFI